MRVFITGASGWIGSAVTDELLAHDHEVIGLARTDEAAAALAAKGATAHRGDLDDLDSLAAGARAADGVIHLAFKHDFSDYAGAGRTEHRAAQAMLDVLVDTGRPFLIASGLAVPGLDRLPTEEDPSPFRGPDSMRGGSENLALDHAARDVRSVALRFSATVHGTHDHGFTARLVEIAKEKGVSGYIGDGSHGWAAVHVSDAARLARLALEKAPAGSRVHAVAEERVPSREIAAAIGDYLGVPTVSIDPEDADAHFGWLGRFFGMDVVGSSALTRATLGWEPTGPTLLEDIAGGAYARAAGR